MRLGYNSRCCIFISYPPPFSGNWKGGASDAHLFGRTIINPEPGVNEFWINIFITKRVL